MRLRPYTRPYLWPDIDSEVFDRPNSFHDGITYDARVRSIDGGLCVVKAPGAAPQIGKLTDFFTFTSSNNSKIRGSSGLLVGTATNVPRIEYDLNGGVLGVLLESSRQNIILRSEEIDNAAWTKSGLAGTPIGANAGVAPDGVTSADQIVEASGGTFHLVQQDCTVTANSAYSISAFLKAAGRNFARIQLSNTGTTDGVYIDVNLSAGTIGTPTAFGTGSGAVASITAYGNGWYRVSLTGVIDAASTTARVQVLTSSALGTINYSGDGVSGVYLWGVQLELGAFATSYVPTTSAGVTRAADVCNRTYGSEWGASAGTFFAEFSVPHLLSTLTGFKDIAIIDGSGILLYLNSNNDAPQIHDGTNTVFGPNFSPSLLSGSLGVRHRAANSYGGAGMSSSSDGQAVVAGSFDGVMGGGGTSLCIGQGGTGGSSLNGHIRRFQSWPERKSDAFLRAIAA